MVYPILVPGMIAHVLFPILLGHRGGSATTSTGAPDWMLVKAEILVIHLASLCTISLVNFSLALVLGAISVPLYVFFQPRRSLILKVLQQLVLFHLSPVVLVLVGSRFLLGLDPLHIFSTALYGYDILGSWTFPLICFGYCPLNIATMCFIKLPPTVSTPVTANKS